jgi:hypothetical protein
VATLFFSSVLLHLKTEAGTFQSVVFLLCFATMVKVLINVTDKTHVKRLSKIRMIPFKISLPSAAKNGPPLAQASHLILLMNFHQLLKIKYNPCCPPSGAEVSLRNVAEVFGLSDSPTLVLTPRHPSN